MVDKQTQRKDSLDAVLIQLCSERPSDVWRGMEQVRKWLNQDPEARDVYGLLLDAVQQKRELLEQVRNILSEMTQQGSKAAEQTMLVLPSSVQDYIGDADDAYYAAEFSRAIELYKTVLEHDPDNQRASEQLKKAQKNLITYNHRKELPREAVQYFKRARSNIAAQDFTTANYMLNAAIEIARKAGVSYPDAEKLLPSLSDYMNYHKWKVFISYSRNDVDVASDIYRVLQKKGYNVWMDMFDLVSGQNWKLEIHKNIKSSDFFIACLSKNSVSKRGYVQKELKEALAILDEIPEGEIYIIPVRIDNCEVPFSLTDKHWLDWFAPQAKENILKALSSKK